MNKNSYLLAPLVALAIGIILICLYDHPGIVTWMIILLGIAVLVPGVLNILWIIIRRGRKGVQPNDTVAILASAIACFLGIWLIAMPGFFEQVLVYAFGVVLLYLAVSDVVMMVRSVRPARLPWGYYIVPLLMIAAAVVMVFTPLHTINTAIVLTTGIALTLSAANRIVELVAPRPQV